MKNKYITIVLIAIIGLTFLGFHTPTIAFKSSTNKRTENETASPVVAQNDNTNVTSQIQIALILDTSNSMDGLIDQAKSQLWKIINELAKAQKDSTQPSVSIALYEYGNSHLSVTSGYIRQVLPFTADLDDISEKLFSLQTDGGEEYCGQAIYTSLKELNWSNGREDLRVIYIAGNEPFNQGSFSPTEACQLASQKNISVFPIYCGDEKEGRNTKWEMCAKLTAGTYMSINSDLKTVAISTPYDDQINGLNVELNNTYIYYGEEGKEYKDKQTREDYNQLKISKSNNVSRTISKSSHLYRNGSWDLVDAFAADSTVLTKVKNNTLADSLQNLKQEEFKVLILQKSKERENIKNEIATLATKRAEYISVNTANSQSETLGDRMIKTIQLEAQKNGFVFN